MVASEDTIFAPLFWGFVVSIFLGGMTVIQAHVYFPAKGDRGMIRWTAAVMLLFDISSSILVAYSVYYYLIPEFGSFERFKSVTPQFSAECLIAALITFISQMYFAHQLVGVKRTGKGSWIVIGMIVTFSVLALGSGIGCVATMYIFDTQVLAQRNKVFTTFFGLAKGLNALTDIIATLSMCLFLTDHQKGGIERTNNLLARVMVFVIQRGVLVTLIQVAVCISFYAAPGNLAWLALHMNVTRLYANTFFAMLNGRASLRRKQNATIVTSLTSSGTNTYASHGHRGRFEPSRRDPHFHFVSQQSTFAETEMTSSWLPEKQKTSFGHGVGAEVQGLPRLQMPVITKSVTVTTEM